MEIQCHEHTPSDDTKSENHYSDAKSLWKDIMTRHGREANYWLEYANMERYNLIMYIRRKLVTIFAECRINHLSRTIGNVLFLLTQRYGQVCMGVHYRLWEYYVTKNCH